MSFKEFYPYYLAEHSHPLNRLLHFIGTLSALLVLFFALVLRRSQLLVICPLLGYLFAWIGHFFVEKNKPATFKYPLLSLAGDFAMFYQLLTRRLHFGF